MSSTTQTSTSAVITTLVANLVFFGIFVTCFLLLRLKFKRIYSPKSSFDLVPEDKKPEPLPADPFRWIYILLTKPHTFIIQHCGLDGYLFLRYLLVLASCFIFGMLMYMVLLPVNAAHGAGHQGFDMLSISNVKHKGRYYAHVFVGWAFYGGIVFVIYRELFFYNSLRTAAISSPKNASKVSARTVLFQSVPNPLLDEKQFYKLFNGVKRIYVARTSRKLESSVRRREALCMKLEAAENKLLKTAMKAKLKADKKGTPIEGTDINSYVPENKRPRHKLGGFFSKKVDTINYCLEEIPKVDAQVKELQKTYRSSKVKNSIFVEFEDQYTAQLAYQAATYHTPLRMGPATTNVAPEEVYWPNMRMYWWEQIFRRFTSISFITALVIFWAIPVAFVGVISNITYLTNKLPWLRWILNLPDQLLGLVTGLLPTILLAILMALLPIFIRHMAKVAGAVSLQQIELFTQSAYFGFLIINSFLVVTIASSATSVVTQIIDKPQSAMSLLATNLPKSSNFYISYVTLQGLSISSASLFQVVGLFLYYILGTLLDSTVRKKWSRFSGLGAPGWGTTFPVYTNIACIVFAYSVISPLILAFATVAFLLVYIAFAYNLAYVNIEAPETYGLHYPRALFQTFTGIYLGQVCMLGIFAVGKGWGPIVLQAIGIGMTVFAHINLNQAFDHLIHVVPLDCMKPLDGVSNTASFKGRSEYQEKVLSKRRRHNQLHKELQKDEEKNLEVKDGLAEEDVFADANEHSIVPLIADRDFKSTTHHNFLVRFFRPDIYMNYRLAKLLLPATYNVEAEMVPNKHAYDMPSVTAQKPTLWIPRDPMGLSTVQVEEISKVVDVTDENAGFNEKGKIVYLGKPPF